MWEFTTEMNLIEIQGDSGGKVNIWGGNCHKEIHMNMCLLLNGYRVTAV
jgi:hypothetical protein